MDKNIKKISICIPTTELKYSNGVLMGVFMLNHLLKTIESQTYKNYEIIISDHSLSNIIEKEIEKWLHLDIKYFKNDTGIGSAAINLNYAISKSTGEYIKTIFQDDFFYSNDALEYIINNINNYSWGAVGTNHCYENNIDKLFNIFSPNWIDPIKLLSGVNTISGPSVLFFKNDNNFFDENLGWLNDVEFYYRLYKKYGLPLLLPKQVITQRSRNESVSNVIENELKTEEKDYVFAKHNLNNCSKDMIDYPNIYKRINNIKIIK